jgi:cytochrome c-type biogenesis protein CcmI
VIPTLVVTVLALIALAYVLAPILHGPRSEAAQESSRADEAEAKKHAALLALSDLETEHEIGKLSTSDFELLRAEYEREALEALEELDAVRNVYVDDQLEAEIAAMKSRIACSNCGELVTPGEPCPKCETIS